MDKRGIYERIQQEAVERYQKRYRDLGVTPRSLGWGCRNDQLERFKVLCTYNDFNNKSILDVGCGFADFYKHLLENHISCHYIGIEIIPEFVEHCKKTYPEAEFYHKNLLLEYEDIPKADFVISLGTLNFKLSQMDNLAYSKDFMAHAYKKANYKLILDFLSAYTIKDYPKEEMVYYHTPQSILEYALELTSNVELIHNYLPIPQKEFMIMLTGEGIII